MNDIQKKTYIDEDETDSMEKKWTRSAGHFGDEVWRQWSAGDCTGAQIVYVVRTVLIYYLLL